MHIVVSDETILLVVKFRIGGNLRFLSHAETLRVFQRACVRAGMKIRYSQGFNPHPKLSLPLPRSVGVEADDDLLCLRVDKSASAQGHKSTSEFCDSIKANLSQQLPAGFELISVTIADGKTSFQPCSATYILEVKREYLDDKLKNRIGDLLANETLNIQRKTAVGNSEFRIVDVRGFLKSIVLKDKCIVVECKVGSAGSIRVEEILELLELDQANLAAPIRRTAVQWQKIHPS
jgi:radical SAM-linked protein